MVFGVVDLSTYTFIHVVISLIAIVTGLIVAFGMIGSNPMMGWTALFLFTTILTSLTGFGFPFGGQVLPSHAVGAISLLLLLFAVLGYYMFRLVGAWRWIYVVTALLALWFNVLVLIVQAFQKIEVLAKLAPTQSEPPFQIAQGAVLLLFVVLGALALWKFRPPVAA